MKRNLALLISCSALAAASAADTVLSSLAPESSFQGWGTLQTDKGVAGTPLTIAGRAFTHGLGIHAASEIVYDLGGEYDSFSAWVGVDDHLKAHPDAPRASVVFQVAADGKTLFDSGVMRIGDAAKEVKVSLKGVAELKLLVSDAGDGNSCDHADWAEPVLTGNAAPAAPAEIAHTIKAGDFSLNLAKNGAMISAQIGNTGWPVSGGTRLQGFRPQGEIVVDSSLPDHARAFTTTLTDSKGHACTVTDRFTPEHDSIRWDVAITSADPFWSVPITTRMQCAKPENTLFWTAWGSPDFSSNVQLTPELTALVQAGKASAGGAWSDPLVAVGFVNRNWHYGNVSQACPVGGDYVSLPVFTLLAPASDTGLSLVLSPDDVLLKMDLAVSANGRFQYARSNHRLGGGKTVKFVMHLVPHEASWRGGLRFLTACYPQYFEAPNPRANQIAGCGAYTRCEAPIDVAKFKKMALGFNWKLSDDFPYMGMFIPPVKDIDEKWNRSCGEPAPKGQEGPETSCRQMNTYAKYMKDNGFSVLSYFNVTEYGNNVNPQIAALPPGKADDPQLWQDGSAYLKAKLPHAWLKVAADRSSEFRTIALADGTKGLMSNCYGAAIVDPGDPDYLNFMCEQARRNIDWLPDTDGICIDRTDWLRFSNVAADDQASWIDNKPARSLFRSWRDLMARMGPLMHQADKVIFSNMMTMRLELCKELDGIYTEFGNNGNALNGSSLLGIRKPVVAWSYNETLGQPNPDAFMQRHLHLGAFPTAPYPNNNHCINPEPRADRLYLDYGPLLTAMRGRKWVLVPHCVETTTPGVKMNLFEVPAGYALPVTFGGTAETATVRIRNIHGLDKLRASVLHPGADGATPVSRLLKDGVLTLTIPLKRGCAMIQLTKTL
ncbi:MAG: NPCBM/NEW2 domain-containing protein [Akkermansiaceae bacterium]|nr:NPCBM/NEW2 domain-containing protein [Akkermansiaceae bacterium]